MSVLPMQRVTICALKKNRKEILDILQRLGTVEIKDVEEEDGAFQKNDTSEATALFTKKIAVSTQALKTLQTYLPDDKSIFSSLEGRKAITVEEYDKKSENADAVYDKAERVVELTRKIAECKAAMINPENQIEALNVWTALDVPMNSLRTKKTVSYIGTLSGLWTLDDIYVKLAEENDALDALSVEIISAEKTQTCVFMTCANEDSQKLEETLRAIGFTAPAVTYDKTPLETQEMLRSQIQEYKLEIESSEAEIKELAEQKENIRFLIDYFTMKKEKYEVMKNLIQSHNTFYLEGYVPKAAAGKLADELNAKLDIVLDLVDSNDEDTPVILKNNKFSMGAESVVESYSLPGKGEFDPTSVMSFFYYFFFGLMLGDFVYGLLMFAGCLVLLLKFKNMEIGTRKFLSMFMYCGLSTMFWGVMFGSYMGDIVNIVSKNWFGSEVGIPALWFVPINEPMRMLVYSLGFGLVHMYVGLGMLGYKYIKDKQYTDFIYDVVFWLVMLSGLVVLLLNTEMFQSMAGMVFTFSPAVIFIAKWGALISAVGIILTSGRESRGFKRILKGLYGLYGASGWLSDVLSYSRLLALGLATGVIASVINQMAAMLGTSVFSTIMFVVILILGHTINIGINALGAYVHTNRLQFVEFFGKFYNGGGKKFKPFAANTTYYKFKEEIK